MVNCRSSDKIIELSVEKKNDDKKNVRDYITISRAATEVACEHVAIERWKYVDHRIEWDGIREPSKVIGIDGRTENTSPQIIIGSLQWIGCHYLHINSEW